MLVTPECRTLALRSRDACTDAVLRAEGWRVLRFWEHEDPDRVVDDICRVLSGVAETDLPILLCHDSGSSGPEHVQACEGPAPGAHPGTTTEVLE